MKTLGLKTHRRRQTNKDHKYKREDVEFDGPEENINDVEQEEKWQAPCNLVDYDSFSRGKELINESPEKENVNQETAKLPCQRGTDNMGGLTRYVRDDIRPPSRGYVGLSSVYIAQLEEVKD